MREHGARHFLTSSVDAFKVGRSYLETLASQSRRKCRCGMQISFKGRKKRSSPAYLEATEEPLGMKVGIAVDFLGEIVLVSVCQCERLP